MPMATLMETLASANELLAQHVALVARVRDSQKTYRRKLRTLSSPPQSILKLSLISSPKPSPPPSPPSSPLLLPRRKPPKADLPPAKRARATHYENYIPEEETIRNDYSQRYVDGGEWPQNWVLGAEPERRFEEYPKQQRLLALKKASVTEYALPPIYLPFSELATLQPSKFDVIVIDPPLSSSFSWDTLQELPLSTLATDPSFVFLWVGSGAGDGLERGREVLAKWGYRRCEDVCWVKTNRESNDGPGTDPPTTSLLTRTKQHCLIGIRGTVRRSTDSWFVHCNVDTDVILWEGDPTDPTRKPPEMYTLVENFCLGLRRLELFARARSLRRGWVSVLADGEEAHVPAVQARAADAQLSIEQLEGVNILGQELGVDRTERWDQDKWENAMRGWLQNGRAVVPMTPEVDALRPKSPVRVGSTNVQPGAVGNASGGSMAPRGVMKPPRGQNMMDINMGMNALGVGMGWPMGLPIAMPTAGMMSMVAPGFGGGGFDVGMHMQPGMGWMGLGAESGQFQYMDGSGGMWEGGMGDDGMVGDGLTNIGGMSNMGIGNMGNMGMGNMGMSGLGMGVGGMGMGQQGYGPVGADWRWNNGGFEGG
ncbi:MT-A70-domain-containing protein [Multifurca ochricompacta]|uniref:MT-A70-domain-containing protein n=1 Tax=Multifurca ochricompacta TaxID=376703 RepID=A0AAD4M026_9AGAM|nr:MT-A70-domain-containing protein [Multifurca ochricompacta]